MQMNSEKAKSNTDQTKNPLKIKTELKSDEHTTNIHSVVWEDSEAN